MARITVDDFVFTDPRFDVLGRALRCARSEAVVRMMRVWHVCTERGTDRLPRRFLAPLLRCRPDNLVDTLCDQADLGEVVEDDDDMIRLRGGEGRLEWLARKREARRTSGTEDHAGMESKSLTARVQDALCEGRILTAGQLFEAVGGGRGRLFEALKQMKADGLLIQDADRRYRLPVPDCPGTGAGTAKSSTGTDPGTGAGTVPVPVPERSTPPALAPALPLALVQKEKEKTSTELGTQVPSTQVPVPGDGTGTGVPGPSHSRADGERSSSDPPSSQPVHATEDTPAAPRLWIPPGEGEGQQTVPLPPQGGSMPLLSVTTNVPPTERRRFAQALWQHQNRLRRQIDSSCPDPEGDNEALKPVLRQLTKRSPAQLRHVLEVCAAEAESRQGDRLQWFNGHSNWSAEAVRRALATTPERVRQRVSDDGLTDGERAEKARQERRQKAQREERRAEAERAWADIETAARELPEGQAPRLPDPERPGVLAGVLPNARSHALIAELGGWARVRRLAPETRTAFLRRYWKAT